MVLALAATTLPVAASRAEPAASPQAPAATATTGQVTAEQVAASKTLAGALAAQATQLQEQLTRATADAAAARVALDAAQQAERQAIADRDASQAVAGQRQRQADEAGRQLAQSKAVLGRWAAKSYMQGPNVPPEMMALLSSGTTDELASSIATQRVLGRQLDSTVSAVQHAEAEQARLAGAARSLADTAQTAAERTSAARQDAEKTVADRDAAVSRLTQSLAGTRAQADSAQATAAAQAVQLELQTARQAGAADGVTGEAARVIVTGSPTAQQVMDTAAGLTGIPYKWGGTTTAGFDCSGFTGYVFAQVGVSLPRTARQQQAAATPVTDPQPGDLVFFGRPATHVGIYAGNGLMYDSPHTGAVTTLRKVHSGVTGYGRVLPG